MDNWRFTVALNLTKKNLETQGYEVCQHEPIEEHIYTAEALSLDNAIEAASQKYISLCVDYKDKHVGDYGFEIELWFQGSSTSGGVLVDKAI